METPFLVAAAESVDGSTTGYTRLTAAEPETTDDEPRRAVHVNAGSSAPFLAADASGVAGEVIGYTVVTRAAPETTDDPGGR